MMQAFQSVHLMASNYLLRMTKKWLPFSFMWRKIPHASFQRREDFSSVGTLHKCCQPTVRLLHTIRKMNGTGTVTLHFCPVRCIVYLSSILSTTNNGIQTQPKRTKSKGKQRSFQTEESDSDDDDSLEADDFSAPVKFKVMKIHTASMRTDAIISKSLDVSRHHLEEVFYGPGLLLNGNRLMKKSMKMEEGDYVDVVMEKVNDQLKVKRVKVMKMYDQKTNTDKLQVKVRVWKAPFLISQSDRSS